MKPPTRPALRERYNCRQQRVVAAAARLFAQQGYHTTTMGEVAEAAGFAAGAVYHYTSGKEELLFRICDDLMEPLLTEARLIVTSELPAEQQLRNLVRAWLVHIERHRDHMLVFQQERLVIERQPRWHKIREQRRDFEDIVDHLLGRCEAERVVSFADRQLALLALLGMANHTAQWLRKGGRLTTEEIADGYCQILLSSNIGGF